MSLQVHMIRAWLVCAYLIECETGLVLVDTGFPGNDQRVLRKMRTLGRRDLQLIYITHAHLDHYGSAAALQRLTGAAIAIHRADADAMACGRTPVRSARGIGRVGRLLAPLAERVLGPGPTPCDTVFDDGDNLRDFGLDAVVIHTPGHTPGSSCLLVEERLASVGDLLTSNGQPVLQHLYADDWLLLPDSLARVQRMVPRMVYPGHARRPLSGDALQWVRVGLHAQAVAIR
jgi:hydroxyacylglutathione hydrolase